jgi:hypothetical protein
MPMRQLHPSECDATTLMRSIAVFVEDFAREQVLNVLIRRVAQEADQPINLTWGNTRNGHGAVVRELRQFMRDLQRGKGSFPDLIVVATDGNCMGFTGRRKEITDRTDRVSARIICAIPDSHIERWLMIDSAAFKAVFGVGCDAPDQKCDRNRYKQLLVQAIRKSGVFPSLGGIEYAEAIASELDLDRAALTDPSLARFIGDLRNVFKEWQA